MHWWNAKKLTEKLKAGTISANEKVIYLFVTWFIFPISLGLLGLDNIAINNTIKLLNIVPPLICYYGIKQCYLANLQGDDQNFFERIMCLSLPLGIQAYTLGVILGVTLMFVFFALYEDSNSARYVIEVLNRSLALLIFFIRLKSYMLDISGAKDHNTITNTSNV